MLRRPVTPFFCLLPRCETGLASTEVAHHEARPAEGVGGSVVSKQMLEEQDVPTTRFDDEGISQIERGDVLVEIEEVFVSNGIRFCEFANLPMGTRPDGCSPTSGLDVA